MRKIAKIVGIVSAIALSVSMAACSKEPTVNTIPTVPPHSHLQISKIDTNIEVKPEELTPQNYLYYGISENTLYIRATEDAGFIKADAKDRVSFYEFAPEYKSIKQVVFLEPIALTDCRLLFAGFSSMESIINLKYLDTSRTTNMTGMFRDCSSIKDLDVSNFDMSACKNTSMMFQGCSAVEKLNVANWDMSNVEKAGQMFAHCDALTTIDVSNWDVYKVRDTNHMFTGCNNLTELKTKNWEFGRLMYSYNMFYGCSSLKELNVSAFNMANTKSNRQMFDECTGLKTLYVPATNGGNISNASNALYGESHDVYCMMDVDNIKIVMN